MCRSGGRQRASRICANRAHSVSAAGRARRQTARGSQFDIRSNVRSGNRRARDLAGFQSPLIHCGINLAEVVDASIRLGGCPRFHKVRNGDGRQEADDGHDDHDFHQGEAGFTGGFYVCLFHTIFLSVGQRWNNATGWLI